MLLWLLYAMGVYTYPKIHPAKLGSSNSTVESLSHWVCRKIHLAKLESIFLALHTFIFKLQLESIHSTVESMSYWKIHLAKLGSSNSTVVCPGSLYFFPSCYQPDNYIHFVYLPQSTVCTLFFLLSTLLFSNCN